MHIDPDMEIVVQAPVWTHQSLSHLVYELLQGGAETSWIMDTGGYPFAFWSFIDCVDQDLVSRTLADPQNRCFEDLSAHDLEQWARRCPPTACIGVRILNTGREPPPNGMSSCMMSQATQCSLLSYLQLMDSPTVLTVRAPCAADAIRTMARARARTLATMAIVGLLEGTALRDAPDVLACVQALLLA